jgi:cell division protease FtsH
MITQYGMSDKLGPRTFGKREELVFLGKEISEQRDYSDKVAQDIDQEVHDFIVNAHKTAQDILTKNKAKMIQIAEKLIADETIEGAALDALFDAPIGKDSVVSVKPAGRKKRPTLSVQNATEKEDEVTASNSDSKKVKRVPKPTNQPVMPLVKLGISVTTPSPRLQNSPSKKPG